MFYLNLAWLRYNIKYNIYILILIFCFKVPVDYKVEEVVDLFFKSHLIFELQFHPHIKNLMSFLQVFIYEMKHEQIAVTTRMKDVKNKILG